MTTRWIACVLLLVATADAADHPSPVVAIPEAERQRLQLAEVYTQYVRATGGIPVVASRRVQPAALAEAAWLIDRMLARRPDIAHAIARSPVRVVVMAHDEFTTDVPEHSDLEPKAFWDKRARGLGATLSRPATSCGEENLLGFRDDPYATENILIHEFAHTIHEIGLAQIDPQFAARLEEAFAAAKREGRWKNTYALESVSEYWAEAAQSWLACNRVDDDQHGPVNSAADVRKHDPLVAALLTEVFGTHPWCYQRPDDRAAADRGHLHGFDAHRAPRFDWGNLTARGR